MLFRSAAQTFFFDARPLLGRRAQPGVCFGQFTGSRLQCDVGPQADNGGGEEVGIGAQEGRVLVVEFTGLVAIDLQDAERPRALFLP